MRSRPSAQDNIQNIKKTYTKIKRLCDQGLPREILHSKDTTIQSVKIGIPFRWNLGGRKTEALGEKTTAFLRGTAEETPSNYNWPSRVATRRPESQRRHGVLTKSISGWYPLNIRGLEKAEGARNTMAKINKQRLEMRDLKQTQSRTNWLPRASRLWPKRHKRKFENMTEA